MGTPTDAIPPAADEATLELRCPLCDYDLRGLPESRCPECGHAFDIAELRRAVHERRLWLFEHAQRRKGWSFLHTTFLSFVPEVFWRRVVAAHEIVPRRLWLWWSVWIVLAAAGVVVPIVAQTVRRYAGSTGVWTLTWIEALELSLPTRKDLPPVLAIAIVLLWPALALIALQVFSTTLRQAGIRRAHLMRCTLYALPLTLLPVFATYVAVSAFAWNPGWLESDPFSGPRLAILFLGFDQAAAAGLLVAIFLSTFHLMLAHVLYLRLRHAVLQALLVQMVVWTAVVATLLWLHA